MSEHRDISVVSPVFNEQEIVENFFGRLDQTLQSTGLNYEIVFVDDGSRDESFDILKRCRDQAPGRVKIVRLARNFGHQLAISAGLKTAVGDAVVVMDSDLQDSPEIILAFIAEWKKGSEIVYGIRKERKGETFFKKVTARFFYRILRTVTSIDIPEDVGDFYLLDRKVVDILNSMQERHRFIRGLVAWVGFQRKGIEYVREPRLAGKTKYTFWRMVKFSFDAATSFSFAPLRAISFIGLCISGLSFLGILVIIYQKLFTNTTVLGWASLMVGLLFIGGIQLLAIGMIGEYIARIGDDVKQRPLFTVREVLG